MPKKPEEQTEDSSGVMGPCPLDGNCLINSVIYKAEVTDENSNKTTYTSNTFKIQYYAQSVANIYFWTEYEYIRNVLFSTNTNTNIFGMFFLA